MKKNYTSILSLILIASISLFGCKKTQEDYTSTAESAESFAQDQPLIFSNFDMIDDFLSSQNFMQKNGNPIIPAGAEINYVDTIFDNNGIEIQIGFSGSGLGQLCGDNIYRNGLLTINTDKPYSEIGSKTRLNFLDANGFTIAKDNMQIRLMYESRNLPDHFLIEKIDQNKYSIKYSVLALENFTNVTESVDYEGEFLITKVKGFETPEVSDDEIKIEGSGKGFSFNSNKYYNVKVVDPLYKTPCAKIFTKGKLTLQNEGSDVKLEINFGDGTCDSKIEVKSGAFKKEITL